MIDKADIKCRFKRSVESYNENAVVQKVIVIHLQSLIEKYLLDRPEKILEIGCGTGFLTRKLKSGFCPEYLTINDLVEEMCRKTAGELGLDAADCLVGDVETLSLSSVYDLVASASTFQWLSFPERTLEKLAKNVTTGGMLAFSVFGADNLQELKILTGKGLFYPSRKQWETWLSGNFEIVHVEEKRHILYFSDPVQILRHVKTTGANATDSSQIWTKGKLQQFREAYSRFMLSGSGYPLTYHPVYFICRKK